jgi:hypothetical protein
MSSPLSEDDKPVAPLAAEPVPQRDELTPAERRLAEGRPTENDVHRLENIRRWDNNSRKTHFLPPRCSEWVM